MTKASFSFDLRVAGSTADLEAACLVRATAYGHHTPSLQDQLSRPEPLDTAPGVVVLVCRDKISGRAIGSARVQSNAYGALLIEQSVTVPHEIANHSRAEITRLSVVPGGDPQAKLALFKGVYLCCLVMQVRWMIIGARNGSLKTQYERLGFGPLVPDDPDPKMLPLVHTGNLLHHVLRFDVTSAERHWHENNNALYRFMFRTFHADMHLFSPTAITTSDAGRRDGEYTMDQTDAIALLDGIAATAATDSQRLTSVENSSSVNGLVRMASIPATKQA